MDLFKRDDGCPNGYFRSGDWCYSIWQTVVRWVVIGVVILLAIGTISLFIIRRRRLRNRQTGYGSGWGGPQQPVPMGAYPTAPYGAPPPSGPPQQDYYAADQQGKPPPQYGAPQYGAPEYGVQPPQPSYQPPEGPPPVK